MPDREILNFESDPGRGPWKTLATFSAEQTAEFFSGGELGPAKFEDPEIQAAVDRQRKALRSQVQTMVYRFGDALHRDSPQTEKRLYQLWRAADAGDPQAKRLLVAMLGELVNMALT